MDSLSPIVQYFIGTIGATMTGIIYCLTIENLQPVWDQPRKFQKLWLAALLSALFTPLGALIISNFLKIR